MVFQNPLTSVQVRHFIPGRVRLKIGRIRWTPRKAMECQAFLLKMEGIKGVEVRLVSGSVILQFDRRLRDPDQVLHRLQSHCASHRSQLLDLFDAKPHERKPDEPFMEPQGTAETTSDRWQALALWSLGGTLAVAALKRVLFGSSLSASAFSPAGLLSLAASAVLWKKVKRRRPPHHRHVIPLINSAALLAVANSQALTAIEILFVGHASLWVEEKVEQRVARYLRDAFPMPSPHVEVLEDGRVRSLPLKELRAGQVIRVHPHDIVPVDGPVAKGLAVVDSSHLTGRAEPQTVTQGDWVYAGSRVLEGTLEVLTEKHGDETSLARIQAMVCEGLAQRTELERKAQAFSRRTLTVGSWATAATLALTADIRRTLNVFLIFSCPCAMVLAASSVVAAAVAAMVRRGVIVKNGRALELAPLLDAACFDKTGTLTEGLLSIREVHPRAPWISQEDVVLVAAAAEKDSAHPVAAALRRAVEQSGKIVPPAENQSVDPGHGVEAHVEGETVLVGSRAFMEKHGVSTSYFAKRDLAHRAQGRLVVYVAKNGRLQGLVAFGSSAPKGLEDFLRSLRKDGFRRVDLISGDSAAAVQVFAQGMNFDRVQGDLDPVSKAQWVEDLSRQGFRVLMVGDGINDTPAFSRAHVSVALAPQGALAALEAADVVILNGDVRQVQLLRHAGRKMVRLAHQNFAVAMATNGLAFGAAMTGWMGAGLAGLLHLGHMAAILGNAARMFDAQP